MAPNQEGINNELFNRDELAEEGGKPLISGVLLKLNVQGHLEQAKHEMEQMLSLKFLAYDRYLRTSKANPDSAEEHAKRCSIVAGFYRHIGLAEIKNPTALKLAMKHVACGTLHIMLDDKAIDEKMVERYLQTHPNIIDFSKYTCPKCGDIELYRCTP